MAELVVKSATPADGTFSATGATTWDAGMAPSSGQLSAQYGGTGIAYFKAAGPTVERTYTFPDAAATIARTDAGQTFTGVQVFSSAPTFSSTTATRVLFAGTAGALTDSASLLFASDRLTIGTGSTTSAGLIAGNVSSGVAGLFLTKNGVGANDYAMSFASAGGGGSDTISINAVTGAIGAALSFKTGNVAKFLITNIGAQTYIDGIATTSSVIFRPDGGVEKLTLYGTAGRGPDFVCGTAATNVAAQSITQTWNNAACATGWKLAITDTTSAAGALPWQVLGGAAAATALASLTKAGKFEAVAYRVNGTDGADFGPGMPTSITVVKGIITAIS
jgi:hypothetical protein